MVMENSHGIVRAMSSRVKIGPRALREPGIALCTVPGGI
jgi:hypothetical protein